MRIFNDTDEIEVSSPVATIGIFDGVHRAHKALIRELKEQVTGKRGNSLIVTLWPHPRIVLNKGAEKMSLLNTLDEKISLLDKSGVDNLLILPFNSELASTNFETFVQEILVKKVGISKLVVGYNHHFGKNREGNYEKLKGLSEKFGFDLIRVGAVSIEGERVSSSVIRNLLYKGNVRLANELLGYYYNFTGTVVDGNKIGRNIGYPTANILLNDTDKLVPAHGVYAVAVQLEEQLYNGMMNIGIRPTFHSNRTNPEIEVHLFDFKGDLYNRNVRVYQIQWLRAEKKFGSADELKAQISLDEEMAKNILQSLKKDYF